MTNTHKWGFLKNYSRFPEVQHTVLIMTNTLILWIQALGLQKPLNS